MLHAEDPMCVSATVEVCTDFSMEKCGADAGKAHMTGEALRPHAEEFE